LLADVPDGKRRDGGPEMLPRRRDESGKPVQELKRREFDDAIGPRLRGLAAAAGPHPVGGFVSG
jgi:hypothetical protein